MCVFVSKFNCLNITKVLVNIAYQVLRDAEQQCEVVGNELQLLVLMEKAKHLLDNHHKVVNRNLLSALVFLVIDAALGVLNVERLWSVENGVQVVAVVVAVPSISLIEMQNLVFSCIWINCNLGKTCL